MYIASSNIPNNNIHIIVVKICLLPMINAILNAEAILRYNLDSNKNMYKPIMSTCNKITP